MISTGFRHLADVTSLRLDQTKCDGCRICTEVCPHGVFEVVNHRSSIVDRDACMECGACASNCETGAITVQSGVGCATAIIYGALTGCEPSCGGDTSQASCCG